MKRLGSVMLLTGVLALALSVFGFWTSSQVAAQGDLPDPEDTQAVWNYITEANPYSEWGTWPEPQFEGYLQSGAPHSKVVRMFVNETALDVASSFPGEMPDGSIIVKDNMTGESLDSPGDLGAVTVMYKVTGYNPDGGDWFWAKYQADGSVDAAGRVASCAGCHLGIEGHKDGLLRWGFEGEPAVASAAGSEAVQNVMQQMQQPEQMPETGAVPYQNWLIAAAVAGVLLILAGFALRRKAVTIRR